MLASSIITLQFERHKLKKAKQNNFCNAVTLTHHTFCQYFHKIIIEISLESTSNVPLTHIPQYLKQTAPTQKTNDYIIICFIFKKWV